MKLACICALAAFAIAGGRLVPQPDSRVVNLHYTPRDQQTARYAYVPIEVPPGTTRLTVSYRYDRANGSNAVDLGVYEPGPLTLGTRALRGWSGGSLDTISIGTDAASPGYWPGPLPAGQWHVVLGLYKVAAGGLDVEVAVDLFSERSTASPPTVMPRQVSPLAAGPAWYVGILHAHTTNSDGTLTPQQLAEKARGEHLDFIAITDHNNTVHQLSDLARPDLVVITGEEVTTPGGHFNVWGLGGARDYVDFRIPGGDPSLAGVMDEARRRGGVVSINHPTADCAACTWTWDVPAAVQAIEIANGTAAARQQAMVLWDTLLRSGRRITAIAGRDWHGGPSALGSPSVRVWAANLSAASILDGLRQGRAVVVASSTLPAPELSLEADGRTARVGDTLVIPRGAPVTVALHVPRGSYPGSHVDLVWDGEVVATSPLLDDGRVRFDRYPAASGYARAHVAAADGSPLALTNPVFVTVR